MVKFLRVRIKDITSVAQDFEVLEIKTDNIPDEIRLKIYNIITFDTNTIYDVDEITGLFKTNCILRLKCEYMHNKINLDLIECPISGMFIENMKIYEGYLGITNENFINNVNDDFLMQLGERYQILVK